MLGFSPVAAVALAASPIITAVGGSKRRFVNLEATSNSVLILAHPVGNILTTSPTRNNFTFNELSSSVAVAPTTNSATVITTRNKDL